jgi:hypothetical protein
VVQVSSANLHQPQIDQIAGTLMMVRSPRVWSCSRLAICLNSAIFLA